VTCGDCAFLCEPPMCLWADHDVMECGVTGKTVTAHDDGCDMHSEWIAKGIEEEAANASR
jgi:hypothetical protein